MIEKMIGLLFISSDCVCGIIEEILGPWLSFNLQDFAGEKSTKTKLSIIGNG